jgi:hypothetical protein
MPWQVCYSTGMRSSLVALVLAVTGMAVPVPAPVSVVGDVLTGHSRHDLYDPMRTRQGGSTDVLNLVPDSAMACWSEDNGYGAEKICGAKAGHVELA